MNESLVYGGSNRPGYLRDQRVSTLGETHCYLICGTERAILLDTGLGVSNIRQIVDQLAALSVQKIQGCGFSVQEAAALS